MSGNLITKAVSFLEDIFVYRPDTQNRFILGEQKPQASGKTADVTAAANQLAALLRYAKRLAAAIEQTKTTLGQQADAAGLKALRQLLQQLEAQKSELSPLLLAYSSQQELETAAISASLAENRRLITELFELPGNQDIVLREVVMPLEPPLKAMLVFAKGLIDAKSVTASVLTPLFGVKKTQGQLITELITQYLPNDCILETHSYTQVIQAVNTGYTALFIEGNTSALLIETKGFERRALGRPMIEQTIRGSQVAFTEALQTNLALIRLSLRSRDLVTERMNLGERSQTDCALVYLKSIANPSLVAEVRRRLSGICTDFIAPGTLEHFIEDHPQLPLPQILSTERPDRISVHLAEGRVAVLMEGDPFALVMPISVFTLFQSPEDFALKTPAGTFMRVVRFLSALVAAVLPSLYIAVTYYHPEVVPTDLLLAIAGARERVPFPAFVEVIFMELSLELIREAGLRKPGLLGETLGIVGGIILGQAVVTANLISPITVVIVAVTAIASFAIPDFRTGMAVRQARFLLEMAAMMLGLIGVASSLFVLSIVVCSMTSFGVPLVAPLAPKTKPGLDVISLGPVYRQEKRPDELNPLDTRRQPPLSREWLKDKPNKPGGE